MALSSLPKRTDTASRPFAGAVQVMVVDDSAIVRSLVCRMLRAEADITVAATAADGDAAVTTFRRMSEIDVIVLDVEMPVRDGLSALKDLLQADPQVQILMASTLTQRNAEISLRALALGAADYLPKPSSQGLSGAEGFQRELVAKVRALGLARQRKRALRQARSTPETRTAAGGTPVAGPRPAPQLRPASASSRPGIIAIGSSTGGPQALATLFEGLVPGSVPQPIVITQHMPPTFTAILADHLGRGSGWPCAEARHGEAVVPGRIYLAPGDHHMTIDGGAGKPILHLNQEPPENFCRPSVDPMLRSIARVYGSRALVVMLTGMGSDGLAGSRDVVNAGGRVIAQDEASSVVWGMPGAVANAGLCTSIVPLTTMAQDIIRIAAR